MDRERTRPAHAASSKGRECCYLHSKKTLECRCKMEGPQYRWDSSKGNQALGTDDSGKEHRVAKQATPAQSETNRPRKVRAKNHRWQ